MFENISDRMKNYEFVSDQELMRRVPVVIRIDGKNFSRVTSKALKPYDHLLSELMVNTAQYVASEIQGCCFHYTQSDEISLILRNDQTLDTEPYLGNRIQKITSIVASMATRGFDKSLSAMDEKPTLVGDVIFDARVFTMPSLHECVNYLIWRQQDCLRNAISGATQTHLSKKLGKKTAFNRLIGMKSSEKVQILQDECGIDFDDDLPTGFRLGICSYKVPVVKGDGVRNKWMSNWNMMKISENKDIYLDILQIGHDIIRNENVL
jgi:tRNA(His) guanylyltransferase